MGLSISGEKLLLIGLAILPIAIVLLKVGFWSRRRGQSPFCRKCEYNLTGLTSTRCPECGTVISPETTIYGERRRKPVLSGLGCLGLILFALAAAQAGRKVNWYLYYPASWVVRDLDNQSTHNKAYAELTRRITTGRISSVVRALIDATNRAPFPETHCGLLATAGTPEAIAHLEKMLRSSVVTHREAAVTGLGPNGGRWAVPLLISALDDPALRKPPFPSEFSGGPSWYPKTPEEIAEAREQLKKYYVAAPWYKKAISERLGIIAEQTENQSTSAPSFESIDHPSLHEWWPPEHKAHTALFLCLGRLGMRGRMLNLAFEGSDSFDVQQEIKGLKSWWSAHGDAFMNGKPVPSPQITMVWANDP